MPASKRSGKKAQQPQLKLDPEVQRDIMAVALLVVSIFTAITLFFPAGELGRSWSSGVTSFFGWGSMVVAIAVGLLGALMLRQSFERSARLRWQQVVGVSVLLLVLLGTLHVILAAGMPQGGQQAAEAGGGGGRVGYAIGPTLISGIGTDGGLIVLAGIGCLHRLCSLNITVQDIQAAGLAARQRAIDYYHLNLRPVPPTVWKCSFRCRALPRPSHRRTEPNPPTAHPPASPVTSRPSSLPCGLPRPSVCGACPIWTCWRPR